MKKSLLILFFAVAVYTLSVAQIRTPQASPTSKIEQTVGLGTITVEYSRPSIKGRKVFGDLVPFGQLWRTGANSGTKITFTDDVKINGAEVKKGKYALFTQPGENEWAVILHKNADLNVPGGDDYKTTDEALRFMVKTEKTPNKIESFTINFSNLKDSGADLYMAWENTKVTFFIDVNTDSKVTESIKSVMAGPSANDYMAAANYYLNSGKDINQAVEWANKGVSMGADQFWNLRAQSLILAKAGKTADAVAAAKKSLMKAQEAKNTDYIKMNEKSIADWTSMKK